MATTFSFPKPIEDVEDVVLLPRDWYDVEVADDPKILPNKTLKGQISENASEKEIYTTLKEDPKAGYNLVVKLITEHPDPRYSGRDFSIFLGFPSGADDDRWSRGQKVSDRKMQNIARLVAACGGTVKGKDLMFSKGMKCCVYIDQVMNQAGTQLDNSIDIFNAGYKKYGRK